MTLIEKFDTISCKDCRMHYADIKCTMLSDGELNVLEQIADEFAIGFVDWIRVCKLKQRSYDFDDVKKLLEIYKDEKDL